MSTAGQGRMDGAHASQGPGGPPGPARPALKRLEGMDMSELEDLLTNEDAFKSFAAEWIAEGQAARALTDLHSQNVVLARGNLALSESIAEARNHVAIVKSSEYAAMKSVFEALLQRQSAALEVLAPSKILQQLRVDVEQVDAKGTALHDRLLSGNLSVDSFVSQYLASRTVFHAIDLKRQGIDMSNQ